MFKKAVRTTCAFAFALAFLGVSSPVSAAMIDFRTAPWGPGGAPSETNNVADIGNVTVTAKPTGSTLSHNTTDGFGVNSLLDRDDEVDVYEILEVVFGNATSVAGAMLTDFYTEHDVFGWYQEKAFVRFDGAGPWMQVLAPVTNLQSAGNGEFMWTWIPQTITKLEFGIGGPPNAAHLLDFRNEFHVAGVDASAVPEPGSMILVGTGLAAALARARKKRADEAIPATAVKV